jgi:hypothetical protein
MATLDLSKLSKKQLEQLAASAFAGKAVGDEGAKKGVTYGGLSMPEMMKSFNDLGAEDMLRKYGSDANLNWGY